MPTFALSPGFVNGLLVPLQLKHIFEPMSLVVGKVYGLSAVLMQKNAAQAFRCTLATSGLSNRTCMRHVISA